MLNKQDSTQELLTDLGLKRDEAKLYIELLKEPSTHLRLAHATGINRTKVYRLADQLEKRGLVASRTDDRGTFLVASDPATLEADLVAHEEKVRAERQAFETVIPMLIDLKGGDASKFVIQTYDGEDGFKQLLWHELKAKGEVLVFGSGKIESMVPNRAWAEKHRALTTEAGYKVRQLSNPRTTVSDFTDNQQFLQKHYQERLVSREIITFQQQMVVYNDTVTIYNVYGGEKVGIEIINTGYANTMRQVFEHYWRLAEPRK